MMFISKTSLYILQILFLISAGGFVGFSQQTTADYSFLRNLKSIELEEWLKSKPKDELDKISENLLFHSEKRINQGNTNESEEYLNLAQKLLTQSQDSLILGKFNYLKGLILIEKVGERKAKDSLLNFMTAKEHFQKLNTETAKLYLGKTLLEITNFYIKTANSTYKKESLSNITLAYKLSNEINSNYLLGLTYKNLGMFYFFQTKYIYALEFFEKSESYLIQANDYNALLEVITYSMLLYKNLIIRDVTVMLQQKIDPILIKSTSKRKKMFALFVKGEISNFNGDATATLVFYKEAQKIALEIVDLSRALSYQYSIGMTYWWEGNNTQAEKELMKALSMVDTLAINEEELLIRRIKIGLASVLARQGKFEKAIEVFEQLKNNLGSSSFTRYNFYQVYANFLTLLKEYNQAKIYLDLAKKELNPSLIDTIAHLNYQKLWLDYKTSTISADETIQKLNESILQIKDEQLSSRNVGLNINYLDEFMFPFHFKTLLQIDKGDVEMALLNADSYKSSWLMNNILSDKTFGAANKHWIISDEAKDLRNKMFQRLLDSGLKDKDDLELENLLKTHEEKMNKRQDVAVLTSKLEKSELSKVELNSLMSTLSGRTVLSYSFTNEYLSIFVIRQNQPIKVFKIEVKESELKDKIEQWRDAIIGQDLGFKKDSQDLYNLLLKPIESEISDSKELIIIPEGMLWKIPFQALLDKNQKYLIQKYPISYVPSLKVLHTLEAKKRQSANNIKNVVGFANPINNLFEKLPQSEIEVKNLSLIYPSSFSFIGQKATETALKNALGKANILHLAVHSKLIETEPMRSSIILTKDALNDGNLEIEEIINFTNSPELVVLSACSTNNGQVFKGEGLLSLSWAFLVAGSKNVIGTQWEIDDKATVEQMISFHQNYSKNVGIAKSLQTAVLKQIEKKGIQNHPYYWAGFVSVGGF